MKKNTSLFFCGPLLILLSGVAWTNERTVDRSGDRGKANKGSHPAFEAPQFSPEVMHMPSLQGVTASRASATDKARALLGLAGKQADAQAQATLQQIVRMNLPSSVRADEVRSRAHEEIARFYDAAPAKQVVHLGLALQYTPDLDHRTVIERRILDLGGDPFVAAFREPPTNRYNRRDPGVDDSCLGSVVVTLPHSEIMNINPVGDHNWRSFDIPGPDGAFVRIETFTDGAVGSDDTDLGLWDDCPSNGGTMLAFNEDKPGEFSSRIDSDCLFPGTYHVEVGGFFDQVTADNFTLEVETNEICIIPRIDDFEPDDEREQAELIGHPTSTPSGVNGWGRSRREIQTRSVFPVGDIDHAEFRLTRNELVRMGTTGQYPTFFNNFSGSDPVENPDTILKLLYENEPDYGGRCNDQATGFLPICFSDADCPPATDPSPLPLGCIPIQLFNVPVEFDVNPLAENDDRGGGDLGSELLMCLPSTAANSPSLTLQRDGGDWVLEVSPFSSSDFFTYELQVKNEVACHFEQEPNNAFETSTPIELGQRIAGIYDFVVTNPYADDDLYRFDVEETTVTAFEIFIDDPLLFGAAGKFFVGPDDFGDFFTILDDDGGEPFGTARTLSLPPASNLLGNLTADADYYLNVTNDFYNPNYHYELVTTVIAPLATETEPNNSPASAGSLALGQRISAQIDTGCDVDTYRFELEQDTFITLSTPTGGDAAIELVPCNETANVLACDDDSAGTMRPLIDGCLEAGSYCATVRAFSAGDTFAYELELEGTTGCRALAPPAMSGDRSFTCLDFQTCP